MKKEDMICFSCKNDCKKCNALFFGKLLQDAIEGSVVIACSHYKAKKPAGKAKDRKGRDAK